MWEAKKKSMEHFEAKSKNTFVLENEDNVSLISSTK